MRLIRPALASVRCGVSYGATRRGVGPWLMRHFSRFLQLLYLCHRRLWVFLSRDHHCFRCCLPAASFAAAVDVAAAATTAGTVAAATTTTAVTDIRCLFIYLFFHTLIADRPPPVKYVPSVLTVDINQIPNSFEETNIARLNAPFISWEPPKEDKHRLLCCDRQEHKRCPAKTN